MAVFRASLFHTSYGQQIRNVLHFHKSDAVQADMTSLAINLRDRWIDFVKNTQSNKINYYMVQIEHVGDESPWPTLQLSINITGNFFSSEIFNFACMVLQLKTDFGGRHGRGRNYISGVYSSDLSNGVWNAAQLVRFNGLVATLKDWWTTPAGNFTGFDLVVCPRSDPTDFHLVTDIVPRATPGTQVRRNFFRGA